MHLTSKLNIHSPLSNRVPILVLLSFDKVYYILKITQIKKPIVAFRMTISTFIISCFWKFLPTLLPTLAHIFRFFGSFFVFSRFCEWLCNAVCQSWAVAILDSDSSDKPINILCAACRSKSTLSVVLEGVRGLHSRRGHGNDRNAVDSLYRELQISLLEACGLHRV